MDPSVAAKRGARFVPESVLGRPIFGVEPGGGARGLAAGLRYVALPGGAVEAAGSFLPSRGAPTAAGKAAMLPDRLHGGFVFLGGRTVFRAETWLGVARAVLDAPADVTQVTAGLDRLYVSYGRSEVGAVDPASFTPVPVGRLPDAPSFVGYAAFDGWHAAAIADLRGLVLTRDAGATWQTVPVPLVPAEVRTSEDGFVVTGRDTSGAERAVDVDVEGHVTPDPSVVAAAAPSAISAQVLAELAGAGPFGARPLATAVEDGWPLEDGSALVLRGGLFARIGLDRGDILETFPAIVAGGSPLGEGARCHPLDLGPALGFVCGLEGADTWLYTFDAHRRQLAAFGHFSGPRAVLAPGNGRVAVHGSCDEHAAHASDVYCLSGATLGDWRELRLEGALDGERVVPLARGGVAVLSPAHGDLARMRLTVRGAGHDARAVTTSALHVHAENAQAGAPLAAGVATLLEDGVWLDGVRETSPGVLGAWVDGHGSVLGLSITLDGDATHGDWVRDLSSPFVSGRFGLGMSAARRGYQTVDGGRHWTPLDTPAPLTLPGSVERRACGPVGCSALGWLRIGWGDARDAPEVPDDPRIPGLVDASATRASRRPASTPTLGCHAVGHPATVESPAPKLAAFDGWSPFFALPAPRPPAGSHGGAFAVHAQLGSETAAKVYVWGPQTPVDALDAASALALPPELQPRFVVRWSWPFGGLPEARSSAIAPAPASIGALMDPSTRSGLAVTFSILMGEGPDEALLVHANAGVTEVFELVAGRPPLAWRTEGPALPPILAAVHAAGHWYVASSSAPGDQGPPRTTLWKVEHGVVREVAEVPRFVAEGHHPEVRLARREDGRAIALLVAGDPRQANDTDRSAWVLPFDLASGALGEPQSLGSVDLADDSVLTPCAEPGGSPGWVVDTSLGLRPRVLTKTEPVVLSSPTARLHLRAAGIGEGSPMPRTQPSLTPVVCLEHVAAAASDLIQPSFTMTHPPQPTDATARPFSVVVATPHQRQSLLCQVLR
jgi:hypothetical protein